jgi:hypothetical protein
VKDRQQFEVEPATSLEEIVRDELIAGGYDDFRRGKEVEPITDENIDQLMRRIYEKIEKEALATYHSNEIWALKQWALNHLLKDEVINEAIVNVASELISPVIEWQGKSYDPVTKFKNKLIADGGSPHSVSVRMIPVVRFVGRKGRKTVYSNDEIVEHVRHLREDGHIQKYKVYFCAECGKELNDPRDYCQDCKTKKKRIETRWKNVPYKPTTLYREVGQLKQFLEWLHIEEMEKIHWKFPVKMPEVPEREDMYQPMLSDEEVETLIFNTVIDKIPASWIVRLAASTLYGCRVSELGDIAVHLNGEKSSIYIKTRKKGERKPQPIPLSLVPVFAITPQPMKEWELQYILKSMCNKADIKLPPRAGWHALRRRVVTDVYEKTTLKEIPIIKYFRWSMKQERRLSQLPTYVKIPTEVSDQQVLAQHPLLEAWQTVAPFLLKLHPDYAGIRNSYNEMI